MNKKIFLIALVLFQFGRVGEANYVPVARIQSPENGSKFKVGEKITFKGKATDLEDGELSGGTFVWTSDMDGLIGQGSSFSTKLSEGSHIVILTATDLEGSSGRASIFIIVGTPKVIEPIDEVEIEPEKPKPEKSKIEKQIVPSIVFLFVPPFGSFENLQGRVLNADPNEFAVAVYIMVDGVWWSKPVIKINKDGKWICDITTTENDELAIKIVAYLIPIDYKPPLASGEFWILKEIEKKSIAKIEVTRKITTPSEVLKLKKDSEAKKPQFKEGPEEKPLIKEEEMKRFFPLFAGNRWRYKRTVFSKKTSLHRFEYKVIEDLDMTGDKNHTILQIGIEPSITTRDEIYEIISMEDKNFNFNIKGYSINEKGENGEAQGFEPYELMELEKLIWRIEEWSNAVFVVAEIRTGNHLGNQVHCRQVIGFLNTSRKYLSGDDPNLNVSMPPIYDKVVITEDGGSIKVKAGNFDKTVKNIFEFVGLTGRVKIVRFFAKDVGLVEEVQYDSKGEITYILELIEYKVK